MNALSPLLMLPGLVIIFPHQMQSSRCVQHVSLTDAGAEEGEGGLGLAQEDSSNVKINTGLRQASEPHVDCIEEVDNIVPGCDCVVSKLLEESVVNNN